MKSLAIFYILFITCTSKHVNSARILGAFPSLSRSHVIIGEALMKALAERGHSVTMISSFPQKNPLKNYRDIFIEHLDWSEPMSHMMKDQSRLNMFKNALTFKRLLLDIGNKTMQNKEVKNMMQNECFDLVVMGFITEFVVGFGAHFQCPTVVVTSVGATKFSNDFTGNPASVAAVPSMIMGNNYSMTFLNRVFNVIVYGLEMIFVALMTSLQREIYQSNFPSDKYPGFDEVKKNVSLVLLNQHFTQSIPRPYIQNTIEVGGLQIKSKPSPLPEDIQEWLDGAEHGAIFFSFGSNLKGSDISQEKLEDLLQTFSKLKQRVLWKWDMDELPNKPDNVMLGKWLPQDDILAHNNIKLFITHGGLGSVAEAKYHGVPIVGMPFFGDQPMNLAVIEKEGWAVSLDFKDISEEKLMGAIKEVLNNPRYKEIVKEKSNLYRDRPLSAMDTAIFWVEYVIRHKGAHHMRYQGVDLNFFQANSIDVILFLLALGYIAYFILKIIAKQLWKLLTERKMKEKIN